MLLPIYIAQLEPSSPRVDPTVSIRLGSSLPDDAIARLAKLGLKSVYTDQIEAWERRAGNIGLDIKKIKASKEAQATKAMKADSDNVELALEFYLLTRVLKHYPFVSLRICNYYKC